jgi:hypothetical protein
MYRVAEGERKGAGLHLPVAVSEARGCSRWDDVHYYM